MVELRVKGVSKKFFVEDKEITALADIEFRITNRQSVAIVGPSGCGKTTLVRMIAGLETPSDGRIFLHGKPLTGPDPRIMMVFQGFALLPWKTVLENVELGLLDKPEKERREIADKYLRVTGMDGFAESYPRDLSSGGKQRIGIARALAREPDILIMDEPFAALDPLTSRNLQNEILRYYYHRRLKPDVIMLVTHNIPEAVYMADRIIVMGQRPGYIKADMKIELERPKNMRDRRFQDYVDEITSLIT
ncbi:Trehalose/maltose import ATP-binding protein MalK [uncultured archaeon]|nr:Trehalose/maltose import ATP-binding protein MalK [uncultured archaeon]